VAAASDKVLPFTLLGMAATLVAVPWLLQLFRHRQYTPLRTVTVPLANLPSSSAAGQHLSLAAAARRPFTSNAPRSMALAATPQPAVQEEVQTEWPMNRVRQTFIDYFAKKHEHTFWPTSPVAPLDDPTLLFTNAGMNQFKPLFLGIADPAVHGKLATLTRAVNSQKCIRAGGKHNDLEDVGKDTYHHTFFEMLGNWSFGSYFKKEAIPWAWECLTQDYGLDPSRMYATYFGGDPKDPSVPVDEEARDLWLQFLPEERVIPCGAKDNFWEMGDTGPCGPCTEIHYDRREGRLVPELVNADDPELIEIWNIVFIQFNREDDGQLRPLPAQHVDTGMGFERITSILQNKDSNYDTDIFTPIFEAIQEATGARPYAGKLGEEDPDNIDMAYRVVADHIRTLTFAIADGASPSNEGRGYVLRRVLRRAVRYGQQVLGGKPGFFHQLVPTIVETMKDGFPDIVNRADFVMSIIKDEEFAFNKTLGKGVAHFEKVVNELPADDKTFKAEDAHFLYASLGFPVDLTELMAEERGLVLDREGFAKKMKEEAEISAIAAQQRKLAGGKDLRLGAEQTAHLQQTGVEVTDAGDKYNWHVTPSATVKALFIGVGEGEGGLGFVDVADASTGPVGVVLDASPFYPEAGGQVADTGRLQGPGTMHVENTQIYGGFVLHTGSVPTGELRVGDAVQCAVDYERRAHVAPNHTMTHVLNHALRDVLCGGVEGAAEMGGLVDQKGSLCDEQKLRFDFSWNGPVGPEQLQRVEAQVNACIDAAQPVDALPVALEQAKFIYSLRSVFGEQYPDPVRVVSVGNNVSAMVDEPQNKDWAAGSIEFCGGTHIANSAEAERFVIMEESGIAKGVRRIVAVTRSKAREAIANAAALREKVKAVAALPDAELDAAVKVFQKELLATPVGVVDKGALGKEVETLIKRVKKYQKQLEKEKEAEVLGKILPAVEEAKENGKGVVVLRLDFGTDGKLGSKLLKEATKAYKASYMVFSASSDGTRFGIYASTPKGGLDAKAWCAAAGEPSNAAKVNGGPTQANAMVIRANQHLDACMAAAEEFAAQNA
jgi:alanyl-tRNA synthetase